MSSTVIWVVKGWRFHHCGVCVLIEHLKIMICQIASFECVLHELGLVVFNMNRKGQVLIGDGLFGTVLWNIHYESITSKTVISIVIQPLPRKMPRKFSFQWLDFAGHVVVTCIPYWECSYRFRLHIMFISNLYVRRTPTHLLPYLLSIQDHQLVGFNFFVLWVSFESINAINAIKLLVQVVVLTV